MRLQFNLRLVYYKLHLLFSFIAISIWVYFATQLSSDSSSSPCWNQGTNKVKILGEDHNVPAAVRENQRMACNIPKLDPFNAFILEQIRDPAPAKCETYQPLIFTTDLNSTLIQVKNPKDYGYFSCCYKEFIRFNSDSIVMEGRECFKVKNGTVIPSHHEFITIYCKKRFNGAGILTVPVDMFSLVHLKPDVEKRVEDWEGGKELQDRRVNVVILGLDSVSQMNFKRIMPKTLEYITKELNAIGMEGYTKVGDGTFPNIVPALTGMTIKEFKKDCWQRDDKPLDSCPFIWKKYSANGYRTHHGEDAVSGGAFNHQKRGFSQPPTDYYINGFTYHLFNVLGEGCLCYGPRLGFSVLLDSLKAIAFRMGNQRRYFQFLWATALFHDDVNRGKLGDDTLLETIKWFNEKNHLENTVFILMSDHGMRFGEIRSTIQGKMEDRMPFLYLILPDWFRKRYRSAVSNLIQNQARLTTHFDLYETLLDLLYLDNITEAKLRKRFKSLQASELPRGISLFLPVPARRTCKDAGIDEHWCVCRTSVAIEDPNNVPIIWQAAVQVVIVINKMFTNFPQCSPLTLESILNALVMETEDKEMNSSLAQVTSVDEERLKSVQFIFNVAFSVSPSNATFEGTITRHTDGEWEVSDEISRTNLYGSQSSCVTNYDLQRFCYCF